MPTPSRNTTNALLPPTLPDWSSRQAAQSVKPSSMAGHPALHCCPPKACLRPMPAGPPTSSACPFRNTHTHRLLYWKPHRVIFYNRDCVNYRPWPQALTRGRQSAPDPENVSMHRRISAADRGDTARLLPADGADPGFELRAPRCTRGPRSVGTATSTWARRPRGRADGGAGARDYLFTPTRHGMLARGLEPGRVMASCSARRPVCPAAAVARCTVRPQRRLFGGYGIVGGQIPPAPERRSR